MLLSSMPAQPNEFERTLQVLDSLPAKLDEARVKQGIDTKTQAKYIGVTLTTLTRFSAPGAKPTAKTERAVLRYLAGQ